MQTAFRMPAPFSHGSAGEQWFSPTNNGSHRRTMVLTDYTELMQSHVEHEMQSVAGHTLGAERFCDARTLQRQVRLEEVSDNFGYNGWPGLSVQRPTARLHSGREDEENGTPPRQ
jgi:hypothetical protein